MSSSSTSALAEGARAPERQKRVLVVDDSALVRQLLSEILSRDPGLKVIGAAPDPIIARRMIRELNPDVVTLDIEMPKMDGIEFLRKIMALRPMPVVMVSSLTQAGAPIALEALEIGAVECIAKPTLDLRRGLDEEAARIVEIVKTAASAHIPAVRWRQRKDARIAAMGLSGHGTTEKIIAIGASTGGVEALNHIIGVLPADAPAVLVTQHMPEKFTRSFAERLDGRSAMAVSEARDGERALPGHVYIAPGNRHLLLARSGANYICKLDDKAPVSGHRPSVDVLFHSVGQTARANAIGVILTGMGRDGARGLAEMRAAGAHTIGQDERSCVVYGMPRAAFEAGGVERQLGLDDIAPGMLASCAAAGRRAVRV